MEDRLVGVMGLFSHQPFTASVMEAMASVAMGIAQGVGRKRTEEALRQSEDQLRQSQKMDAIGREPSPSASGRSNSGIVPKATRIHYPLLARKSALHRVVFFDSTCSRTETGAA